MAKGISIHIGVNELDPSRYGTLGTLRGCENDARAMSALAESCGFASNILLTKDATAINVLRLLSKSAEDLAAGDILLLTYAGHGSQIKDVNRDEDDELDETWCLYDRMLIDDEFDRFWFQFRPGVRIVMISDSCHSGTVSRKYVEESDAIISFLNVYEPSLVRSLSVDDYFAYRVLDPAIADRAYLQNQAQYDEIIWSGRRTEKVDIQASVLQISACQDNQTAADGTKNGYFTSKLLEVWDDGSFAGNYYSFHKSIVSKMPGTQTPRLVSFGSAASTLEKERPFAIANSARKPTTQNNGGYTMPKQTTEDVAATIQDRLARLKGTRSRIIGGSNGNSTIPRCKFELDVDRDLIGMSDEEVYHFLQNDCCDVLMEAYMNAKAVNLPRGVEGGISCSADTKGNAGCTGSISIRF